MVQPQPKGLKSLLDLRKIEKPTGVRIDLPFTNKFDAKAMAVQPAALMPGWGIRQAMGRLEPEFANESHLSATLVVGNRLRVAEGVDLLILGSLDHTVLAVCQVDRGVSWRPRMAQRSASSSGDRIADPSASGTIHACNNVLRRIEHL